MRRLSDFIHACGAASGIQLGHSGRKSRTGRPWERSRPLTPADGIDDWDQWELVAPSALPANAASPVPQALSTDEAAEVARVWGRAAARGGA